MVNALVLAEGLAFPEGPVFSGDGSLWGVELNGGALFRWRAGDIERVAVGGRPNGLAVHDGALFFCDAGQNCVRRLDPRDSPWADPVAVALGGVDAALTAPNDLAFSPGGTMVFTCPGDSRIEATGTVWAQRPGGDLMRIASDLRFPNGLAFTPDGRELIVAETYLHRLWRGGWDEQACRWRSPRPWIEVGGPIGPDGMAFGPDGDLYVAIYGKGCVVAVDLDGSVRGKIQTPGSRPTNVAFDPSGALGLVVTEAERGMLLSYPEVGTDHFAFA
jgi:gluconolactonase